MMSLTFGLFTQVSGSGPLGPLVNPLYSGGLFHCYMLDKSICHFRGVRSILLIIFCFNGRDHV